MEILFIIDEVKDIKRKIALLDNLGADIKFFVDAKCVSKISRYKTIVGNIVSIYNKNVNLTIDKYLKSNYSPKATIIYYSSTDIDNETIEQIRHNLEFKPDTIYFKKKLNWWGKLKLWFYQKLSNLVFGMKDEFASVKLQYFSEDVMNIFKQTSFKNHIFNIPNSLSIEIEKEKEKSYYTLPKFNKNYLYNPIAICLILICYVVIEKFLKLPFWVYFLVVALILATIINLFVMIIKDRFDIRYKK